MKSWITTGEPWKTAGMRDKYPKIVCAGRSGGAGNRIETPLGHRCPRGGNTPGFRHHTLDGSKKYEQPHSDSDGEKTWGEKFAKKIEKSERNTRTAMRKVFKLVLCLKKTSVSFWVVRCFRLFCSPHDRTNSPLYRRQKQEPRSDTTREEANF